MRLRDDMTEKKIGDEFYLVPFAGAQADRVRSVRLNATGAFIAKQLAFEITERALYETVAVNTGKRTSEVESDTDEFLAELEQRGLLEDDDSDFEVPLDAEFFDIAGIKMYVSGSVKAVNTYLSDKLYAFECAPFDDEEADHEVMITRGDPPEDGSLVFMTEEFILSENMSEYIFYYNGFKRVGASVVSKDFSHSVFFLKDRRKPDDELREELFIVMRTAFLLAALKDRKVAIHCVALQDKSGTFLLSGPSGMGKTTLATLITEAYKGVCIKNGDLALVGTEDGRPYFYGIPWCGTSETYSNTTAPVDMAAFLHQAQENRSVGLGYGQAQVSFFNRLITPSWTEEMLDAKLYCAGVISGKIKSYDYYFKNERKAAEVFYERRIADHTSVQ